MPPKKIGEGAQARYNEKRPTIAFRSPSVSWKDHLQAEADKAGQSVGDYIIQAVENRFKGRATPNKPKAKPKAEKQNTPTIDDPKLADAADALDALSGSFPPEFD